MIAELNVGSSRSLNLSVTSVGAVLTVLPSGGVARTRWACAKAALVADEHKATHVAMPMMVWRMVMAFSPSFDSDNERLRKPVTAVVRDSLCLLDLSYGILAVHPFGIKLDFMTRFDGF